MRNSDYWKERFVQLEKAQNSMGTSAYAKIERQYKQAQKQIEAQISMWYQRFAKNNGITLAEARQWLTGKDLKEFQWDVKEYIKRGEEYGISGKWAKELENASAKFHISKLEALKIQTQQSLESLFGSQQLTLFDEMGKVYKSGYYHTAFELQRGFNIGWDIAGLNQSEIEKILAKPWAPDKYNFSERIWKNKTKLINEVHKELTQNILTGADPQKAIDAIAKKMNASKYNAGRLVMTEEAYFSSAAQRDCFNELNVEQYEIVATLDSHTSEICQALDGKHFPMKDYQAGVTAPPFHVNCRSTTVPYFDDNFGQIGQRAARDEETGKTYYVPDNMTYEDWKQSFVDDGSKEDFQPMAGVGNNWNGANPTQHTSEELRELNQYAEERGIKLYNHIAFDGDINLIKAQIDTMAKIRADFGHTDFIRLGWKRMNPRDFGETSANHQQIWINALALRNREITELNLSADNFLAANQATGIVAHEMGHVISGKLKKGITGLDIYKQTVYNVSGKMVSDDEAVTMLLTNVSVYSGSSYFKNNGRRCFDELIPEMLSVHYTEPNGYSSEFVKLLKEALE